MARPTSLDHQTHRQLEEAGSKLFDHELDIHSALIGKRVVIDPDHVERPLELRVHFDVDLKLDETVLPITKGAVGQKLSHWTSMAMQKLTAARERFAGQRPSPPPVASPPPSPTPASHRPVVLIGPAARRRKVDQAA